MLVHALLQCFDAAAELLAVVRAEQFLERCGGAGGGPGGAWVCG